MGIKGTLPRQIKAKGAKRTKRSKATEPEDVLQARTEEYLDSKGVSYIRIPDSLNKAVFANGFISSKDKAFISSYLRGLPDLTIFHPRIKLGKYAIVLPLELKTQAGEMSNAQLEWQDKIGTIEAKGWSKIKAEIDEFLNTTIKKEKQCQ